MEIKEFGDNGNIKVTALAKSLPEEVPSGRIDYRKDFLDDLENFKKGSSKLHNGPLKEDLYVLNLFDKNAPLDKRSLKWWTPLEHIKDASSLEEVLEKLALIPEFGNKNSFYIAKIPKGTDVTFISGRALRQFSEELERFFDGGGFQMRFRDFDKSWKLDINKILQEIQ